MSTGSCSRGRIATTIVAAQRPPLGDDRPEDPGGRVAGLDPVGAPRPHAASMPQVTTRSHRPVVPIDEADGDVGRAKQVARGDAHAVQQTAGVPLGGQFQPDVDQRSQPRVGGSQVAGLLRELVGDQPKVLAIELRRRAARRPSSRVSDCAGEDVVDDRQHVRRRGGFRQDVGHATGPRQRPRFTLAVVRGVEHDGNPAGRRIETQLPDELIAVHHRHQHVGNDQIGTIGPDRGQSLAAIRRFDQAVSLMTQHRHQECPVGREVVNDQDGRHACGSSAESQGADVPVDIVTSGASTLCPAPFAVVFRTEQVIFRPGP